MRRHHRLKCTNLATHKGGSNPEASIATRSAGGFETRRPADLWIFGHTHESEDITIGHTRIVSNAKGYGPWLPKHRTWDNPRFDPNLVVEI
jgi:hypothetical protein